MNSVGKKLAVVEFKYGFKWQDDAILWLQAHTAINFVDVYFGMALSLGLTNSTADQNHIIDGVRTWLQETNKRWLIIFDNALLLGIFRATHAELFVSWQ